MHYQKFTPIQQLKPFVESIWVQEDLSNAASQNYRPTKVLPTGKIDLIFHFRDPFVQIKDGHRETEPKFYIFGQRTKPVDVLATGQTGILIVNFYPWGATPFFPFPMNALENISLDLHLALKSQMVREAAHRLQEAGDAAKRAQIIQEFLTSLLKDEHYDRLAAASIFKINASNGRLPIHKLADDSHMSRRQFIRRFKKAIGVSPKQFSRVIRFQKALYLNSRGVNWSDIALTCGYYDQAHFIKEIRHFSDHPPQKLAASSQPTELMNFFNSDRKLSHFYNTIYL